MRPAAVSSAVPPINERDVEWTDTEQGVTRFRRKRLSAAAADHGTPDIGCSLYELPPGGRSWPYHWHAGNAEALYVTSGEGTLRLDGEEFPLAAGDYVPFPTGKAGAHRVLNDGDTPLRFLVLSTMDQPDVTVYPDSRKVGVYGGSPPGGDADERTVSGYFSLDGAVDYWQGE